MFYQQLASWYGFSSLSRPPNMGASFARIWAGRNPFDAGAWCRTDLTRGKTRSTVATAVRGTGDSSASTSAPPGGASSQASQAPSADPSQAPHCSSCEGDITGRNVTINRANVSPGNTSRRAARADPERHEPRRGRSGQRGDYQPQPGSKRYAFG